MGSLIMVLHCSSLIPTSEFVKLRATLLLALAIKQQHRGGLEVLLPFTAILSPYKGVGAISSVNKEFVEKYGVRYLVLVVG